MSKRSPINQRILPRKHRPAFTWYKYCQITGFGALVNAFLGRLSGWTHVFASHWSITPRSVSIVIPPTHPSECKACNDRVQVPKGRKRIREAGSFQLSGAVYENEMNPHTWEKDSVRVIIRPPQTICLFQLETNPSLSIITCADSPLVTASRPLFPIPHEYLPISLFVILFAARRN
jgi:hypothetical protein